MKLIASIDESIVHPVIENNQKFYTEADNKKIIEMNAQLASKPGKWKNICDAGG